MPHPDVEHGLQIQLATALRELEEEKALAMRVGERAWTAEAERDELKEALAAARRECEDSKADLTTLLGFLRYIICPVCAADHVRVENGVIRGHPPMDRRAAGEGNRCTASRGSLLDVIRDASVKTALVAPRAREKGKR